VQRFGAIVRQRSLGMEMRPQNCSTYITFVGMNSASFDHLFQMFPAAGDGEWEAVLLKELKGGDAAALHYRLTDSHALPGWQNTPSQLHRGAVSGQPQWADHPNAWQIGHDARAIATDNAGILNALNGGCSALWLPDTSDYDTLLQGVQPEMVALHSGSPLPDQALLRWCLTQAAANNALTADLRGSLCADYLAHGARTGQFAADTGTFTEGATALLHQLQPTSLHLLCVDGATYAAGGASPWQQVAAMLNAAVEYLEMFRQSGIEPAMLAPRIRFRYAAGTAVLLEVAAMRSLRMLWQRIMEEYAVSLPDVPVDVVASPIVFSAADAHTNLLRSTAIAMSAAMAGAASITLPPFDIHAGGSAAGMRIARNISHILDMESHFSRVSDPLKGAYAIEQLTQETGRLAWEAFNETEAEGGWLASVTAGHLQQRLARALEAVGEAVRSGRHVRIGVNKYPNPGAPAPTLIATAEKTGTPVRPIAVASLDELHTLHHA
jgi:methylmalonyl-CoA mutase